MELDFINLNCTFLSKMTVDEGEVCKRLCVDESTKEKRVSAEKRQETIKMRPKPACCTKISKENRWFCMPKRLEFLYIVFLI